MTHILPILPEVCRPARACTCRSTYESSAHEWTGGSPRGGRRDGAGPPPGDLPAREGMPATQAWQTRRHRSNYDMSFATSMTFDSPNQSPK
jgi:hypothetical protein